MNFEDLQKAWQSQDPSAKMTINTDALMKEVRHNQRQFRGTIFWRDVREVGVAAFLTCSFCTGAFAIMIGRCVSWHPVVFSSGHLSWWTG